MKKSLQLLALTAWTLLVMTVSVGTIHARLTGTDPGTDVFAIGVSGKEIIVDAIGNLIPGTTNIGSLGTTALKFKDLFLAGNANISGNSVITGNETVTGTLGVTGAATASTVTLSGAFNPTVKTKAQFSAMTAAVGQVYLCSDCTIAYSVCVGTGAVISGWKVSHSGTVGCGTNN